MLPHGPGCSSSSSTSVNKHNGGGSGTELAHLQSPIRTGKRRHFTSSSSLKTCLGTHELADTCVWKEVKVY